ncbi:mitochondrial peripheral inner membrane protein, partial [Perkinsus olseni]
MVAVEANLNQRERPEGAMAACCSIPSSSYASHSDRRIRASTTAKAYVSRAVISVTTSPESPHASGPSTKASTQPWPSPSTGISSDDSVSSQTEGCCPRSSSSSHDATDYVEGPLPRDVLDRTDIDCFLPSLSKVLDHLIVLGEEREKSMRRTPARSRFHSVTVPNIAVSDYLLRLSKFFHCSGECFVIALVYLDRAVKESSYSGSGGLVETEEEKESSPFNITRLNVH